MTAAHDADDEVAASAGGRADPQQGADRTAADSKDSLPPGADVKEGPASDVDRAAPYEEAATALRMKDQPPPS